MFLVSDGARARLLDMLEGVRPKAGQSLRLTQPNPNHLGLALDWEREGDEVVHGSGRTVLLVEQKLAEMLDGVTLVVVRGGADGDRLGLQPTSPDGDS